MKNDLVDTADGLADDAKFLKMTGTCDEPMIVFLFPPQHVRNIMFGSLIVEASDPCAPCGKIRLVKRASTNTMLAQTVRSGYEL